LRSVARVLRAINDWLAAATRAAVVIAVVVMLAALAAQVVMRYVFGVALSWSEELALLLFTWVVLLMSAIGVREGFHVRMDLLTARLPPLPRSLLALAIQAGVVAAGVFLCWQGGRYLWETRGSVSAAIAYPIELLHLAAPVGGLLIAVFALERLLDPLPSAKQEPE
jgi:TRAP-type C4-dicarboxylate transport system permease small subunit